jgi:hypothetical protein
MANRPDDVPATPAPGKPVRVERASSTDGATSTPREHGDIFEAPTLVTPVPNLKSTPQRMASPAGADGADAQRPASRASGTAPPPSRASTPSPPPNGAPEPKRKVAKNGTSGARREVEVSGEPTRVVASASLEQRKVEANRKGTTNSTSDAGHEVEASAARTKPDVGISLEPQGTVEMNTVEMNAAEPTTVDAKPRPDATPRRALPKAAGNRLPSPSQPPRSVPVVTPPIAGAAARNRPPVEVDEPTEVTTTPPEPASRVAVSSRRADVTQIVKPLPPPVEPPHRARSPSSHIIVDDPEIARVTTSVAEPRAATVAPRTERGKRIGVAVLGGAVLVAVILVVAIGFSTSSVPEVSPRAAAPVEATLPPPAPPAAPPAAPVPAQSTAPVQAQPTAPAVAGASTEEPADSAPAADEASALDEIEMSPAPEVAASKGASRPRPRVRQKNAQVKTARSTRALTYDPDALFLKKP